MPNDLSLPDPQRFGLSSFAELLPPRNPIIGEAPGSFAGFHDDMMCDLAPVTPYEAVIAENLVAIEWELLQHRAKRDASLRQVNRGQQLHAQRDTRQVCPLQTQPPRPRRPIGWA